MTQLLTLLLLPQAPVMEDRLRFTVTYGGIPAAGLNIGPNKYGDRTFFSVNWPNKARQWLPMVDHPYDKATSEFIVTAPNHYQVVANGLLQEETDLPEGLRRTHWKQSVPIPSWLNALGVARFGNSVTESDWDDVWLSEGFATYLTLLSTEHYEGREAFVAGLKRSREQVWSMEARDPTETVVHDNLTDMAEVLSGLQYQKCAWILHMLRREIGTAAFRQGIREYFRRYRDSTASTADLIRVMEEMADKELDWFFDQWLHRTPSPSVEGTWAYDPNSGAVEIDLTQTHPGEPYTLRLEVGVVGEDGQPPEIEIIRMTERQQRFRLALDEEPTGLVLDPNTWALVRGTLQRRPS